MAGKTNTSSINTIWGIISVIGLGIIVLICIYYTHCIGFIISSDITISPLDFNGSGLVDYIENLYGPNIRSELMSRYQQMCSVPLSSPDVALRDIYGVHNSTDWLHFGREAWNAMSLAEIQDPGRFIPDNGAKTIPYTILAYGKRLERGRALFSQLDINMERSDEVSYRDLYTAFTERERISHALFREAKQLTTWPLFRSYFAGREGNFLSTMNEFEILQRLATSKSSKDVLILEDDAVPVPDFHRKLAEIYRQLTEELPDWHLAFLGSCCDIQATSNRATANLYTFNGTRCWNAVLISKRCAEKVLETGAIVDQYTPIDHLFNLYIDKLHLNSYLVEPPLIYEESKRYISSYTC